MCKEVEREVCGNCKWWSANDGEVRGMCHVFPPSVVEDPKKGKLTAVSPFIGKDRPGCWMWQLGRSER